MDLKIVQDCVKKLIREVVFIESLKEVSNENKEKQYKVFEKQYANIICENKAENTDNSFLENYSLTDLELIKKDCHDQMEGWRNEDKTLDREGHVWNDRLHIVQEALDKKLERIYEKIESNG